MFFNRGYGLRPHRLPVFFQAFGLFSLLIVILMQYPYQYRSSVGA